MTTATAARPMRAADTNIFDDLYRRPAETPPSTATNTVVDPLGKPFGEPCGEPIGWGLETPRPRRAIINASDDNTFVAASPTHAAPEPAPQPRRNRWRMLCEPISVTSSIICLLTLMAAVIITVLGGDLWASQGQTVLAFDQSTLLWWTCGAAFTVAVVMIFVGDEVAET